MRKRKQERKPNSSDRLKKAQLSFYAEPKDYEALKALSALTGVPQQVYLRRGLAHELEINDAGRLRAAVAQARQHARDVMTDRKTASVKWQSLRGKWLEGVASIDDEAARIGRRRRRA